MAKTFNKWLDEFVENGADASDVSNWPENTGGGGTEVVANPELVGDEPELTGLEVEGAKYKVPEQKQADWNQADAEAKDFIKNKPAIPAAQVQSDWNQSNTEAKDYIKNKPNIPPAQVQADWNEKDSNKKNYIQNKPTLPTVNNTLIKFTQGGVKKGFIFLNQSESTTIDFDAGGSVDESSSMIPSTRTSFTEKRWIKLEGKRMSDGSVISNEYLWTDGKDIYFSYLSDTYMFNKVKKFFYPINMKDAPHSGENVWTDGENIYYSDDLAQRVWTDGKWEDMTWTGYAPKYGKNVWTDGENIYYSDSNGTGSFLHKKLIKKSHTWEDMTWEGFTEFLGSYIWTDGENIYYSKSTSQYVLDKSTSTWSSIASWANSYIDGKNVWTDGENIYHSFQQGSSNRQGILDKKTLTWSYKSWIGYQPAYGKNVWTDGENIYYSIDGVYMLENVSSTTKPMIGSGVISNVADITKPCVFSSFEFSTEKFDQENRVFDLEVFKSIVCNGDFMDDKIIDCTFYNPSLGSPDGSCITLCPKVPQDNDDFVHGILSIVVRHESSIDKVSLYNWKANEPLWEDDGSFLAGKSSVSLYEILDYVQESVDSLEVAPAFQLPWSFCYPGAAKQELFVNSLVVYLGGIGYTLYERVREFDQLAVKLFKLPPESSS